MRDSRDNRDESAISHRRAAAEGRTNEGDRRERHHGNRDNQNRRPNERPQARRKAILTDSSEVTAVCSKILDGVSGEPDIIFGLELAICEFGTARHLREKPVVRFLDAEFGHVLHEAIPNGFEIPLSHLRMSAKDLRFGGQFAQLEELFTTYLVMQPEMKEAKKLRYEALVAANEQAEAARRSAAEKKNASAGQLLAKLKEAKKPKQENVPFGADILKTDFGYFEHVSGVVLFLRKAPDRDGRTGPHMISVASCPQGHELEEAMNQGYVNRKHLDYPVERDTVEGRDRIIQKFREWLRKELRAIGAMPPAPEPGVTAPKGAPGMEAVDNDHARELGVEGQSLQPVTASSARTDAGLAEFRSTVDVELTGAQDGQATISPIVTSNPSEGGASADVSSVLGDVSILPHAGGRHTPTKKAGTSRKASREAASAAG